MISAITSAATTAAAPLRAGSQVADTPGPFGAVLALLLVLALILGLGWLLKRLPGGGLRTSAGLKLVASLPVGPKERLVVIDIAGQQLLLGITASTITALHTLPESLPAAASTASLTELKRLPDFARLLARASRKDT